MREPGETKAASEPAQGVVATDGAIAASEFRARIQSDALEILRVASAIAQDRGQWPSEAITRACQEELSSLESADIAAVRDELTVCLQGRDVDSALQWLYDVGVVHLFLPELAATRDLAQEGGRAHKDVWEHTKLVVKQAVRRPAVRWAALLHDIGKVPTRRFTDSGVHFHGHAEVGARMFDKMVRRMPFPELQRKKIRFLIKYHLRSNQYSEEWTDNAVRRFAREMDRHLTDLLDLSRADITSKRPGRRRSLLHSISSLADRIEQLRAEDAVQPALNAGIGTAIMTHFGLAPSRQVGELKRALETAIESGDLEPRREDEYYLSWLSESGLLPAAD